MRTDRGGFTFIELILVMVIGIMLIGGAYTTLTHQEDAYGVLSAQAATQQDTRIGIELLTSEFREASASDLLMATPDSVRFRALRKFAVICATDKNNKRLTVKQVGADPFVAGDSLLIYVDQDSLMAADDIWQRTQVSAVGSQTCTTTLGTAFGGALGGLFGSSSSTMPVLTLTGAGLRFDSIFPGAPVRTFEPLTYRPGTWRGQRMLMRTANGAAAPLFGPIAEDGLVLTYFDTLGTELTSFPLSAADRGSVARLRVELRAERRAGRKGTYTDSLISDVYLRGS